MMLPGDPVEDLDDFVDFVLSEIGRAAHEKLEGAAPLVLYLADEQTREELLQALLEAMPGKISRKWPR
jgi:uncharacterized protein (DUF1778 family)